MGLRCLGSHSRTVGLLRCFGWFFGLSRLVLGPC